MKPGALMLVSLAATLSLSVAACGNAGGIADDAASRGEDRSFAELEEEARGTTVNFSLYGGDEAINAYVDGYVTPRLKSTASHWRGPR